MRAPIPRVSPRLDKAHAYGVSPRLDKAHAYGAFPRVGDGPNYVVLEF